MKICVIKDCTARIVKTGLCSVHYKRRAKGDYSIPIKKKPRNDLITVMSRIYYAVSGCHEWLGEIHRGYGRASINGKRMRVHRYFWEMKNGPIAKGLHLHHKCHNKACVNVEHLELLTSFFHLKTIKRDVKGRLVAHDSV